MPIAARPAPSRRPQPSAARNLVACLGSPSKRRPPRGVTLVEVLLAMALTLLMMAAVVNLFANVSSGISNRRATIELAGQIRHVRGVLQRDLAGATCPGVPFQRPESNHGYIEIIEGPRSDFDPSILLQDRNNDGAPDDIDGGGPLEPLELDTSALPSGNLGLLPGSNTPVNTAVANAATDGGGLGDWDDALLLTVRNESEPFVGRVPSLAVGSLFPAWGSRTIESPLAEVVWFAVENPVEAADAETFYFGEPGFRTIYRRVLLIAPQLSYSFNANGAVVRATRGVTGPGVVRVLSGLTRDVPEDVQQALAALIAFQERYDLSVRLEWNPTLGNEPDIRSRGRWTIVANTLADLTKRENRYEHFGYAGAAGRQFPFAAVSAGAGHNSASLRFTTDRSFGAGAALPANNLAVISPIDDSVNTYRLNDTADVARGSNGLPRPFVSIENAASFATPRAITNEEGDIVAVTNGFAPLGGARRGEDVMLTNVAAFDLRVFDPQAPLVAEIGDPNSTNFPGAAVAPGDAGWGGIVARNTTDNTLPTIVGRGAYVDLGYAGLHFDFLNRNDGLPNFNTLSLEGQVTTVVNGSLLAGGQTTRSQLSPTAGARFDAYRTYDTWSFHYENNGLNEDGDRPDDNPLVRPLTNAELNALTDNDPSNDPPQFIDEGTNNVDDPSFYANAAGVLAPATILGPDDIGERETLPPYDTRLRGVQVTVRAYELDSRQIREVKVSQTFVPR